MGTAPGVVGTRLPPYHRSGLLLAVEVPVEIVGVLAVDLGPPVLVHGGGPAPQGGGVESGMRLPTPPCC